MTLNQKLTPLLAGRVVHTILQEDDILWIIFKDGSELRIKTLTPVPREPFIAHAVLRVLQADTSMVIDFGDNTSLEVTLAGPTSSVMLRSKNCSLEYAD